MKEKYVLAFDHGTSGMKSAIVDSMGQVMDFEFKDGQHPGWRCR